VICAWSGAKKAPRPRGFKEADLVNLAPEVGVMTPLYRAGGRFSRTQRSN